MIPDTECQSQSEKWQFNRWFWATASTARQAYNSESLLDESPT
jgi:hypothetical protein